MTGAGLVALAFIIAVDGSFALALYAYWRWRKDNGL